VKLDGFKALLIDKDSTMHEDSDLYFNKMNELSNKFTAVKKQFDKTVSQTARW
jgi:hypothetical protein